MTHFSMNLEDISQIRPWVYNIEINRQEMKKSEKMKQLLSVWFQQLFLSFTIFHTVPMRSSFLGIRPGDWFTFIFHNFYFLSDSILQPVCKPLG